MSLTGSFIFDPEDRIYSDHFPGRPVVPGSLIVHAFSEVGKGAAGAGPWIAEDFRFREFVVPGTYDYRLEPREGGWRCLLYHEGRIVASGTLRGEGL